MFGMREPNSCFMTGRIQFLEQQYQYTCVTTNIRNSRAPHQYLAYPPFSIIFVIRSLWQLTAAAYDIIS